MQYLKKTMQPLLFLSNFRSRKKHISFSVLLLLSICFSCGIFCSKFCLNCINECPVAIATLATDNYMRHVSDLSKSILSVTDRRCKLHVVYAGSESDLNQNRVVLPINASSSSYINPFAGIDIKVKSISQILGKLPVNATLLWADASVLI